MDTRRDEGGDLKPEGKGTRKPLPHRLKDATRPAMVQVAPGRWMPQKKDQIPEMSVCRWQSNADGTFTPLPMTERMVRITQDLVTLLGFPGQWNTITRLARAGFIETLQVAPHVTLLNLDSWYNHLRRVAEDSEFWSADGENFKEYRKAIF